MAGKLCITLALLFTFCLCLVTEATAVTATECSQQRSQISLKDSQKKREEAAFSLFMPFVEVFMNTELFKQFISCLQPDGPYEQCTLNAWEHDFVTQQSFNVTNVTSIVGTSLDSDYFECEAPIRDGGPGLKQAHIACTRTLQENNCLDIPGVCVSLNLKNKDAGYSDVNLLWRFSDPGSTVALRFPSTQDFTYRYDASTVTVGTCKAITDCGQQRSQISLKDNREPQKESAFSIFMPFVEIFMNAELFEQFISCLQHDGPNEQCKLNARDYDLQYERVYNATNITSIVGSSVNSKYFECEAPLRDRVFENRQAQIVCTRKLQDNKCIDNPGVCIALNLKNNGAGYKDVNLLWRYNDFNESRFPSTQDFMYRYDPNTVVVGPCKGDNPDEEENNSNNGSLKLLLLFNIFIRSGKVQCTDTDRFDTPDPAGDTFFITKTGF